jgi:GntR family transcriptional regulator, phosphonate transport system regulatory protein
MPRSAIWKSIADTLRSEIAGGQYRPGGKLPTELDLAARFGVNRHTVRHALGSLAEDGILHTRRGSGAFVALKPADYPIGRRVRFHQNVLAAGQMPSREIHRLETRISSTREAEALQLSEGEMVHVVEGVSLADGAPMAASLSVFPAGRLPGLLEKLQRVASVTEALADLGINDYTRASTRLTAEAATPILALKLRIAEGAPILRSVAINIDATGVPIEFGTTWFVGERVTLTIAPD